MRVGLSHCGPARPVRLDDEEGRHPPEGVPVATACVRATACRVVYVRIHTVGAAGARSSIWSASAEAHQPLGDQRVLVDLSFCLGGGAVPVRVWICNRLL